jgi:hypothetical protein
MVRSMLMTCDSSEESAILASDAWYLPSQLAKELGVHHATVLRWCCTQVLPAWRTPSGHWRIGRGVAETLIAQARTAASTGAQQSAIT